MMETTIHMETGKPYAHVKILNDDTSVQEKDVPLPGPGSLYFRKRKNSFIYFRIIFSLNISQIPI